MTIGPHARALWVGNHLRFDGSDQEAITLGDRLHVRGVQYACPHQEHFLNFIPDGLYA